MAYELKSGLRAQTIRKSVYIRFLEFSAFESSRAIGQALYLRVEENKKMPRIAAGG